MSMDPAFISGTISTLTDNNNTIEYIYWYANATIDDISYRSNTETITAPAAGMTLDRDFTVDVTAATISGTALLEGIDVYSASVYGNAYPPSRNNSTDIADVSTGEYMLEVDVGRWN